jgi:hypothetical protein
VTSPSYWAPLPSATQLRLLHLVTAPEIDLAALDAWTAHVDLRTLDEGSIRLLPALYSRLKKAGVDHPWLPFMGGRYRRTLYRNRHIVHRGLALTDRLNARGVPTLLLKGCPLLSLYYGDSGVRPMGDFDLLIEESMPRREVGAILADGVAARAKSRSLHADTYVDRDRFEYDLHWYLMPELAVGGQSRPFWAGAQKVMIEGRRYLTLSAEDHLLHAIIHGMRVSDVPPLRWIVDVAAIASGAARMSQSIDWLRLAESAERLSMALPVARGLEFLIDAGILDDSARAARAALAAAPQRDRLLFAGSMREPSLAFRAVRPWLLFRRLARLTRAAGPRHQPMTFGRFLAELWNLDSPRDVPATAWRKMVQRLRGEAVEG